MNRVETGCDTHNRFLFSAFCLFLAIGYNPSAYIYAKGEIVYDGLYSDEEENSGCLAHSAGCCSGSMCLHKRSTGGTDFNAKKIAISFDAAWGNEETQTLIDILKKYNVKTTFFVVGAWVDKYPESVKALTAAGHEVCNHSNTHPHMPRLSQTEMTAQVTSCNEKIKAITGVSPILFRPPYGDYNNAVVNTVNGLKMYPIQWDVDTLDTRVKPYLK